MEHSNPLSYEPLGSSRGASPMEVPAVISPSTSRRQDGLSQQSRRLQLRNAGFRGPVLPSRRISPIFGSCQPDPFSKPINNENSPLTLDKRTLYGEDMPPSPVNILQEIHNSTKRKRHAVRAGLSGIFQDCTATDSTGDASGTSWYNEQSSNSSPVTTSPTNMMKLRETSLNQKTPPPLSSPLAKHVKGRNLNRLNLRSTSFEATKYIEHLESQLTALNSKIDSLVSPNTNKARAAKLRALTVEVRSLRHELGDWEKNFVERVKDGVEQRLDQEAGLRVQIETLQDEGDIKDMKIKELEFEVETLRLKAKDAEALEMTNLNLEKRIDVLTGLLVQSPTKLDFSSAASSPGKADPEKRPPRPKSMMPMVPSSPGGVRLSLNAISESSFWHGRGLRSNSSISEALEEDGSLGEMNGQSSPESAASEHAQVAYTPRRDSATSPSSRYVASSSSRPTSLHSSSSLGTTSWGVPMSTGNDLAAKSANRQRRMRRFPSGTCSLKPLILPNATGTPSLPMTAPVYVPSDAARRDTSNFSLDPTTAFLSHHEFSSPVSTPTQPGRRTSTTWAQQQALQALEGRSDHTDEQLEDGLLHSPSVTTKEKLSPAIRDASAHSLHRRSRPKSLEEELKIALTHAQAVSVSKSVADGLIPVNDDDNSKDSHSEDHDLDSHSISIGIDSRPIQPYLIKGELSLLRTNIENNTTPKPPKKPVLIKSPPKALPSTVLGRRSAFGLFGCLTEIIAHAKQHPTVLAKRLLYNAWSLGSARFGGAGWWLLGLVFGPRVRQRKSKADVETGEETRTDRSFDWRPYSAKASRQRTAECFLRRERRPGPLTQMQGTPKRRQADPEYEPHVFPCDDCVEPSSRRTLRLWFQFSLTIVLAVGIAIKHGPGALILESGPRPPPPPLPSSNTNGGAGRGGPEAAQPRMGVRQNRLATQPMLSQQQAHKPITFAEVLSPEDFEGRRTPPISAHYWP